MTDVRGADSAARRRAAVLVLVSAILGSILIVAFDYNRGPLRDWLASEPRALAHHLTLVFLLAAAILSASLLAFGAHLWFLAGKGLAARMSPPPGSRVIRDVPIIEGRAAVLRAHALRIIALGFGVASVLLCLLLWELARSLRNG